MKLSTTRYTVRSEGLPKVFNGFKMAVLSDLHDTLYGENNIDLFKRIERENPDVILIAGDLITALKDRDYTPAIKLVRRLSEKFRVYYGLGNHEVRSHDNIREYIRIIKSIPNVYVLDNDSVKIERALGTWRQSMVIAGLTLDRAYYLRRKRIATLEEDYMVKELGEKTSDFTILLAHHPDYFKDYARWGADLIFSGHLHGGLVRLPFIGGVLSPQIKLFPKYDKGEFKEGSSTMIVSAGLGTHSAPRIFNPPELLMVEILAIEKNMNI